MPTKNPRINITLEESQAYLLSFIAKEEHKSLSHVAKELILEALERREDKFLSLIAEKRDQAKTKRVKHQDAWK
jgi:hypothetical protein